MTREPDERRTMRLHGHSISIDNRERAIFSGVQDVESFNEEEVILVTEGGVIALMGQGLHISRLNLEEGELIVEGYILGVDYAEVQQSHKGFMSRLFK